MHGNHTIEIAEELRAAPQNKEQIIAKASACEIVIKANSSSKNDLDASFKSSTAVSSGNEQSNSNKNSSTNSGGSSKQTSSKQTTSKQSWQASGEVRIIAEEDQPSELSVLALLAAEARKLEPVSILAIRYR